MALETFRTATPADAAAITQLVNSAYRPRAESCGWTHEAHLIEGNRIEPAQVTALIEAPCSTILLGLIQSAAVACVHIKQEQAISHIGMFAVAPHLQGKGVGSTLLTAAENHAIRHFNAQQLCMSVISAREDLIAFYNRRGYKQSGERLDYPLTALAGRPKTDDLTIEILKKGIA